MKRAMTRLAALLVTLAGPAVAYAHTGAAGGTGFHHGLVHPLGGLDHLLAMLAVGIWAAQLGGRAVWAVPTTFVLTMALGGALALGGGSLPLVEQGIAASVLILGLAIAGAWRLPLAISTSLVASFAVFHGLAHGAEMPAAGSGLAYGAGFVLSTAALHLSGFGVATVLQHAREGLVRVAGTLVALGGVYLIA